MWQPEKSANFSRLFLGDSWLQEIILFLPKANRQKTSLDGHCQKMSTTELYEQLDFIENPVYEKIISDLQTHNFSISDAFFTMEETAQLRASLMEKWEEDRFKKAAVGNKTNELVSKKIRGDFILWLNETTANSVENQFFSKINALTNYLNRTCFLGILQKEFHYAVYPEGTYYKRHLDSFQNDDRRKLSFVCYLNDANWHQENGGELVLYLDENGKETAKTVLPSPGRALIFESQVLEHEVRPVLRSERLSITGWFKTR